MLKEALSEFRSKSVSMSSKSVNGKGKSAIRAEEAAGRNGKGVRVAVSDTSETDPIIEVEKLAKSAKKQDELEPGDILLMTSIKVPGLFPKIIRAGSNATQGGFNHAAMYVGDNKIVEGRIKRGVKSLSLNKGTKGLSYTVVRPNLPRRIRNKAAAVAKKQIGKEYSSSDLVHTGVVLGLLPDSVRDRVLQPPKNTASIDDKKAMQCAALIAGSYDKAGKKLTKLDYRYVAPVDLLSKTNSRIVRVRKARGDSTQGTPFAVTGSGRLANKRMEKYMSKTASSGYLTVFCHEDATDWCPASDVVDCLAKFFTKEVNVEIYPRYMVGTVWSKDHCDKPYEKDYYAFRAYAGKNYCKIFVDETETEESALWVMLHELAHIALATSPFLFKGYRHLTPPDYFESDEAHEKDPEEQMANSIAMSWMDMLGHGMVNYPRHWWRQRTLMNSQPNEDIMDKVANYDALRSYTRMLGRI